MEFYIDSYIHDRFINNNVKKHKIIEYKLNNSLNIAIRYYKRHNNYFQQFIKMRLVFNTIKLCNHIGLSYITEFCEHYGIINNYKLYSNWQIFNYDDKNKQLHFQQKLHELKHELPRCKYNRRKCNNYEFYWCYHNLKVIMPKIDKNLLQ